MALTERLTILGFNTIGLALKVLFGYRFEGAEHLPTEGPFILLPKEGGGPLSMFGIAFSYLRALEPVTRDLGDRFVATLHEDLWVRFFSHLTPPSPLHPLRPVSGGALSMGMLDQLRALRQGGVAIINPEGDLGWDGRPLPIRPGAAWLGLHTAAPLVPFACSPGAYDAWPLWQKRPNLRGRLIVRMGRPFRLCDRPMQRVTPEDIEQANARIHAVLNELCFGPGGVAEWAGPPLRHGLPLEGKIHLQPASGAQATEGYQGPQRNWGIPQLLWQCPVCRMNDALIHQYPRFRPQTLDCRACGTRWLVRRTPEKDFRLEVVEGHRDVVGLDMPLSTWYDEMMAGFRLTPVAARDQELSEDEEVYLQADGVALLPYQPSSLLAAWSSGEAPRAQPGGQGATPGWADVGTGRLLVTNKRLLWRGPQGDLYFSWPVFRAVFLAWLGVLGFTYGSAMYRVNLGPETTRKWLAYVGTLAQAAATQEGHPFVVSPF